MICCLILILSFCLRSDRGYEFTTDPFVEGEEFKPASGEVFEQVLPDGKKDIRALQIKFGTEGRVNKELVTVSFFKNGGQVRQWKVDSDLLTDQEYRRFVFDRPIKVKENDHCSFTVSQSFEEENGITLRLAEGGRIQQEAEEREYKDAEEKETADAGTVVSSEAGEVRESDLCYRLTVVDRELQGKTMPLFVVILALLSIAAAFLIDFRGIRILKLVFLLLALFLFMEVFTTDLMRRIVTDIPVRAYTWKGSSEKIEPGEEWEEVIELRRADFSTLRIPIGKGEGQSSKFHIQLIRQDSGTVYVDRDFSVSDRSCMTGGGPTGKAVRITAEDGIFPRGTYRLVIRNLDDSENLRIIIQDDGREEKTINYQAVLRSGLGYRIAGIILFLLGACVIAAIMICRADHFSALWFFLVLSLPLSLIYLILMLPWSAPDTGSHIMAANRFSNILMGKRQEAEWELRADDADLFPDIESMLEEHNPQMRDYAEIYLNGKMGVQDRTPVQIGSDDKMVFYSPVNYLPHIIGISIARLLGLGPVPMLYLARILGLITYIAGCAHAVRTTPVGKVVFAAVGLLPVSLMISSSISYDMMLLIASLCFTASVLRAAYEKKGWSAAAESTIWAAILGSVKGGGFLLLLPLVILLFTENPLEGYRRRESVQKALSILLGGFLSVLLFDVILPAGSLFQFGGEIEGKMASSYVLRHPAGYLAMMLKSYVQGADAILFGIGGTRLAWAEPVIPDIVIAGLFLAVAAFAFCEKDKLLLAEKDRIVLWGILALLFLTMPVMLLSWTPEGSDIILGLQGRYYLPALPLFLLACTKFSLPGGPVLQRGQLAAAGRRFMMTFCLLSCLSVYYMMRLYLTR